MTPSTMSPLSRRKSDNPIKLPSPGLLGNNTVCDVGSFSYLIPVADTSRRYTFSEVINASKLQAGQLIGAGAGPFFTAGKNCEMAAIVQVAENNVCSNNTLHGVYNQSQNKPEVLKATDNNFALLGHFLATEGKPGKVIVVDASVRTKDGSIYTFLREALTAKFGSESAPVALGGVFVLENSRGRFHVMPDFPKEPVDSPAKISSWLKFYEMSPPVMGVGTIVSHDPDKMDLKLEHFHCYSENGEEAGHFYYDTEPANAHYRFYLAPAKSILRIDRAIK
nr:unnamed protein product [Spirometra erinaceieuropaei]